MRTLHVDCVVSNSSPAHGHGVCSLQSQGTVTVTVPKSCYSLLSSILEIVEQISIPLATVFNLSLEEGIVPLEWKEANIIPLFKKGSRNKSENYRPVSLTSVIIKLLERLIKDHLETKLLD